MIDSRAKPRVLLLHNFLAPYRVPLFAALATRFDLEVWILADVRKVRDWPSEAPDSGFRCRLLPNVGVPWSRYNALIVNHTLPWALRGHTFDAIVCCAWDTPATFYTAWHAQRAGTPFILWSGSTAHEPNWLRTVTRPAVCRLVRSAAAWLAYGTRAKEYLVSLGADGSRTFCAYNTVDLGTFAQADNVSTDERDALRARVGIRPGASVVLYCGNLLDLKGVGELLKAFAVFLGERDDVALVLVGSGKNEREYQSFVESRGLAGRVFFAGFVAREKVVQYYAIADLLVLPSRREVWGLVVNEALAAGVPVLVTEVVGATPDLVRDGVNGFVVPPRDPEALCGALHRYFDDATDREAMRLAARESIEPFSIARAADAFVDAVDVALGKR